ncbi:MAG TPA: DinB family protein [Verrucomicrobiae bacterium]|nr:DinB family protein [Verrucomicrobiae bacterium]
MIRLEQFLDSWKAVREDAALAVEEFPGGDLDYRPTAELDSFRQIARHILNVGDGLTGMLLARETVTGQEFRDRMKAHFRPLAEDAGPGELAAALRQSVAERCAQLAAQPPEFFSEMMTRHFDLARLTRMEMLQFIKEHELTHRSQLFMYLRLKGVVPPTTRRRLAKQAGK